MSSSFPPGTVIPNDGPTTTIAWTGGDPDRLVRVSIIARKDGSERRCDCSIRASAGQIQYWTAAGTEFLPYLSLVRSDDAEIVVTFGTEAAGLGNFSAEGLTLGGQGFVGLHVALRGTEGPVAN